MRGKGKPLIGPLDLHVQDSNCIRLGDSDTNFRLLSELRLVSFFYVLFCLDLCGIDV